MAWSEASLSHGNAGMNTAATVTESVAEPSADAAASSIHKHTSVISQVNIKHACSCCSTAVLQKVAEVICYCLFTCY